MAHPSGRDRAGTWSPASPEEAAVREAREEVGLTVSLDRRLGDRVHPTSGRHLVYSACRVVSGEAAVVDRDEVAAVEWCDLCTVLERRAGIRGGVYPPVMEYLQGAMGSPRTEGTLD
jgi:8-oxo-dGTP diphosphatase